MRRRTLTAFPAPAGMNRNFDLSIAFVICVPRARGDEPNAKHTVNENRLRSPRPRG
ncbi:conserved hypothetical protein [Candidatus Accumulibacter aalborgensis]|uniref:Uncharacterized protein n=1 Tax=Candidatus Accumulibacter aalborgensis TaxID=1860102 RepID=A0A1A8XEX5_9PROT|nr:conserved hypothetical protein [Candidatus Accumulibacter aalborgensis]